MAPIVGGGYSPYRIAEKQREFEAHVTGTQEMQKIVMYRAEAKVTKAYSEY